MLKLLSRPKGFQGGNYATMTLGRARVVLVVGAPPQEVELAPPFIKMLELDRSVLMTDLPKPTIVGPPPVEATRHPAAATSKQTIVPRAEKKNDKEEHK